MDGRTKKASGSQWGFLVAVPPFMAVVLCRYGRSKIVEVNR
jgi:hypothetical protein